MASGIRIVMLTGLPSLQNYVSYVKSTYQAAFDKCDC